MIKEEYLNIIINAYLKKIDDRHIYINKFVEETGLDRQAITKYLRNSSNWKESTIGVFSR